MLKPTNQSHIAACHCYSSSMPCSATHTRTTDFGLGLQSFDRNEKAVTARAEAGIQQILSECIADHCKRHGRRPTHPE